MWATIHSDILYGFSSYKFIAVTVFIGLFLKIFHSNFLNHINFMSIYGIIISSIFGYSFLCYCTILCFSKNYSHQMNKYVRVKFSKIDFLNFRFLVLDLVICYLFEPEQLFMLIDIIMI